MSSVIQDGAFLEEHDTYFALATKKPKKNGASTGEITNPIVHKLNWPNIACSALLSLW